MENNHPSHKPQQHWSHGAPVLKNGHYLLTTFGRYAISFLLGGLSAAFLIGGKTQNLNDLLVWKGEVNLTLQRMDRDGTNASRWKMEEEKAQITANKILIEDLQKRVEPIGVMQTKIERLERDMTTKK